MIRPNTLPWRSIGPVREVSAPAVGQAVVLMSLPMMGHSLA